MIEFRPRRFAALIVVVLAVAWSAPAKAYRPFDGTDAAVAGVGDLEIEFQPAGVLRAGPTTTALSDAVFNYGFAERWELVLQGTAQTPPEGAGPISVANAAFLKYVVQPGVLQDKPGPSIANAIADGQRIGHPVGARITVPARTFLQPPVARRRDSQRSLARCCRILADRASDFSWTGIMSQRWEWGTVHLNVETNLTPDQHGEFFFDAVIEGPNKWTVRPVFEIYSDSVVNQSQTFSALVGAIWRVRDNLAFDLGLRSALVNGRPVNELRAGVTFGFPLNLGRSIGAETSNAALIGRH